MIIYNLLKLKLKKIQLKINLNNLLKSIKNKFNNEKYHLKIIKIIKLKGRPTALKRSFENIIQNGLIYGNKVYVDISKRK